MTYEDFVDAVARRARLSRDDAMLATASTLAVLSERIGAGERQDLASQLPRDLALAVRHDNHKGERFSLEEFLRRVAVREGRAPGDPAVRLHVWAVLATLRDAVGEGELRDVMAQLPKEFAQLLVKPPNPAFTLPAT
ncbi:MAG TPA: DUF2267 domain-containing protein [Candidatus Dormibacteraeota bacterium]|nr:DUF2267 domain-containing protein [Candidatus Dormibacteraeota bacterium]